MHQLCYLGPPALYHVSFALFHCSLVGVSLVESTALRAAKDLICWGNPLVMTNIAIENGPFIVDSPIKDGDFSWLC